MPKITVLRYGHRYNRDYRLSTHICLIARAFGANALILTDIVDNRLRETIDKVVDKWGGSFRLIMGVSWKKAINEWKEKSSIICHLTMYGENIDESNVIKRIKETNKDVLVVVGSQKIPGEIFQLADFNIAIGSQPHSECAALAVFLDRYFTGKKLSRKFDNAKIRISPQKHGKKIFEES